MPERSTEGDLLTRDTMLLFFLSRRGEGLNISKIAKGLGYPDDSSVNKRIHVLETLKLVKTNEKNPLGWELTRDGREMIWPLTFPRYLIVAILAVSLGNVYWGLFGVPWQQWILVSGLAMTAISVFIWYLYGSGEDLLLGKEPELLVKLNRRFRTLLWTVSAIGSILALTIWLLGDSVGAVAVLALVSPVLGYTLYYARPRRKESVTVTAE
jgi:hypothetical protein